MASELLSWLPVRLILQDTYESWRFVPRITAPTTLIIAEEDNVIPMQSSLKLAQSFDPALIKTVLIQGEDHNSISGSMEYIDALRQALINSDIAAQSN